MLRRFGEAGEWLGLATSETCGSALLHGQVEGQIGGLRLIKYGSKGYVEQLVALSDADRSMSWRIVSHSLNTNPYPAAFLNYRATMRLAEVTLDGSTFVEWECSFDTDYPSADLMRGALRARCESGIRGLATWLSLRGAPSGPPSWGSTGSPSSPSKKRPPVIGAVDT
ncbi:hypothetical protein WJX81_002665 [Elliptochloris bilobata]|uniref:SRPBCC family protein n=1 Tax=Elliptochloris bilobata TaxID=381761 RepID=A0AAW1QK06_9CHLO